MLYGHLYQLRWGDNVKVESRYSLSLFNALKYSWTLCHNPKVVSAWDLLSFRFLILEKSTWRTFLCSWTKRRQSRAKRIVFRAVGGGGVCLSLSLSAIPHAICHHQSRCSQQNSKKAAPKMQYACEKWTYKRSKYSAHTQILYTHIHMYVWKMCNRKPKNFQHWIFLFFLRFTFVLFCFGSAPAHEGAIWNWNCFRNLKCWQAAHKNIFIIKQRTSNHFRPLYEAFSLRL